MLQGLPGPASVWRHFSSICAIPHPSHHENLLAIAIIEWVRSQSSRLRIEAAIDEAGNVVIRKQASPGKEGAIPVILQAHLDMVSQVESGRSFNFLTDPIVPRVLPEDPRWLGATGTTLGADNGIGVAMALAILEEENLVHGPLVCLLTVNEEDGMSGARSVGGGLPEGWMPERAWLLNLDGEDADEITVGCAGSIRTFCTFVCPSGELPSGWQILDVGIGKLAGGHSGVDIDKGRANASLLLVRLLAGLGVPFRLLSISGGTAANAIPRDANAIVAVEDGQVERFVDAIKTAADTVRVGLSPSDSGFTLSIAQAAGGAGPASAPGSAESAAILRLLATIPDGLQAMEPELAGSVRTSCNLGILSCEHGEGSIRLTATEMVRSSSAEEARLLAAQIESTLAAAPAGWTAAITRNAASPAWTPELDSPLLAAAKEVWKAVSLRECGIAREPAVTTTHGGLECGHFRLHFPGWGMISFGPGIEYPHSPSERLDIGSVGPCYARLEALIERLCL